MGIDEILLNAEEAMEKALAHLTSEFHKVRTGKASPTLVENITVEAYEGTHLKLRELASITAPEPRLIIIQPWDASTVDAIRRGIEAAGIGISPLVDGKIIRLPIPELSQERREELVKIIRKMTEEQRVVVRHARRDALDLLRKNQKDGKITEDELAAAEKDVQKLTDTYIEKLDKTLSVKESELLKI